MIRIGLLLMALSLSTCLVKPLQTSDKSPASPTPLPSLEEMAEDSSPASKEYNEVFQKEVATKLRTKAGAFGLKPLSSSGLGSGDVEARFYIFPGFTGPLYKGVTVDESVFVLKRSNSNWTAEAIRKVNKNNKIEKAIEQFPAPKPGWEIVWGEFEKLEIANAGYDQKDGFDKEAWLYIIETKINGKYHFGYFHSPRKKGNSIEEQNFANIFSMLAEETGATDFKTN